MDPIPAIKVNQWLVSWEEVEMNPEIDRRPPPKYFYVLSVPAKILRALSGVEKRSVELRLKGGKDKGIQRGLDEDRAEEIANFIESGYPWSTLSEKKRHNPEYQDLKMPGWLPTAIVINVKQAGDARASGTVDPKDLVFIQDNENGFAELVLPESMEELQWTPSESYPIEVIDGQHRLWAFDQSELDTDFSLPVVAFFGLDLAWQAYLFYVINIKPKKINTSLAYDLYPLLREQDWLERGEVHIVYREARAQELTEALWSHPESPWYHRINMLGETGSVQVRQASWVRNLTATLIRPRKGPNVKIGGLFGTPDNNESQWNRTDQAAILLDFWIRLEAKILQADSAWATALRAEPHEDAQPELDLAFSGKKTLLNTDQGVRGTLHVMNDMLMISRARTGLSDWQTNLPNDEMSTESIDEAVDNLRKQSSIQEYFDALTSALAKFDWRTSDGPGDFDELSMRKKQTYRGSGGYKRIREDILELLSTQPEPIGTDALAIKELI